MSEKIDNGFFNTEIKYALRDEQGNTCCEHCGTIIQHESCISIGGEILTVCGDCFDELELDYGN